MFGWYNQHMLYCIPGVYLQNRALHCTMYVIFNNIIYKWLWALECANSGLINSNPLKFLCTHRAKNESTRCLFTFYRPCFQNNSPNVIFCQYYFTESRLFILYKRSDFCTIMISAPFQGKVSISRSFPLSIHPSGSPSPFLWNYTHSFPSVRAGERDSECVSAVDLALWEHMDLI